MNCLIVPFSVTFQKGNPFSAYEFIYYFCGHKSRSAQWLVADL